MALEVSWSGDVHGPDRGLLCANGAMHPTRPAPTLRGEGWKAAANARAWGIYAHLNDEKPPLVTVQKRKPEIKRRRSPQPLPVEAVTQLLRTRAYTIVEMANVLDVTYWQVRNAMNTIGVGNLYSRPHVQTKGKPTAEFWMARV